MKKKTTKTIKKAKVAAPKAVKIYKLDKGIKMPEQSHASGSSNQPSKVSVTLQAMAPNDSFAVTDELEAMKAVKVVMDANSRAKGKTDGKKYATRKMKKGIRVWRIQ